MGIITKKLLLIASILSIVLLPLSSAFIMFKGSFPEGYFNYPALSAPDKPDFNLWWFIILSAAVLFVISIYLFPGLYGFKKPEPQIQSKPERAKLPWWFWAGVCTAAAFLTVQWGKFAEPEFMAYYGYVPVFWSYVMIIDSIVYVRTNGYSLFSKHSKLILPIALSSGIGWGFFGFLNIFVDCNWFYPIGDHISKTAFVLYAIAGASSLVPCIFVTYHLFDSFPLLHRIYSAGPKIRLSDPLKIIFILLLCGGMFAVSYFPYELYPILWIGPAALFALVLELCRIWTPFTPIAKQGNWTPIALCALAGLVQGITWEGTNFLSATHPEFHTNVPGYWVYSIPYVDILHVFEMPLLGLFGYLPYGIMCWMFWILFAALFNIPDKMWKLDEYEHKQK